MKAIALVSLVVFCSCGGDDGGGGTDDAGAENLDAGVEIEPLFASGTRLKAEVVAGGGAQRFEQWIDSDLSTPCNFTVAEDGATRCLPRFAWRTFSDPACMDQVFHRRPGEDLPAYFSVIVGQCDTTRSETYEVGAEIAAGVETFYALEANGDCTTLVTNPSSFYSVTKVAASAFVAAELVVEPRADGLGARTWIAEDGARYSHAFHDVVRDEECAAVGGGGDACLPRAYGFHGPSQPYTDSGCSMPLAVAGGCGTCTGASFALSYEPYSDTCPTLLPVLRNVTSAYAGPAFGGGFMICDSLMVTSEECLYELGGPFDTAGFPVIGSASLGDGRLQVQVDATASGVPLRAGGRFFDSTFNSPCVDRVDSSGQRYCIPLDGLLTPGFLTRYSDPACTTRVAEVPGARVCPPGEAPTVTEIVFTDTTSGDHVLEQVFEIGAPYEGTVYQLDGMSCMEVSPERAVHVLGPEIPLGAFVTLTTELLD